MDRYVIKTAPAEKRPRVPSPVAPSRVQMRIDDMRRVSKLTTIERLCTELRACIGDTAAECPSDPSAILDQLDVHYISIDVLEETGIGRVIFRLSRQHENPAVRAKATALYVKWRADAAAAASRRHRMMQTSLAGKEPRSRGSRATAAPAADDKRDARRDFLVAAEVDLEQEIKSWEDAVGAAVHRRPATNDKRGTHVSVTAGGGVAAATSAGGDAAGRFDETDFQKVAVPSLGGPKQLDLATETMIGKSGVASRTGAAPQRPHLPETILSPLSAPPAARASASLRYPSLQLTRR